MKKNLVIKNNIPKSFLKKNRMRKSSRTASDSLNKIFSTIEKKQDIFHLLSKKFNFSFKKNSLKKYKKYKKIIVLGMGGSILGAKAIHCFLKHRIKKFIDTKMRQKQEWYLNSREAVEHGFADAVFGDENCSSFAALLEK